MSPICVYIDGFEMFEVVTYVDVASVQAQVMRRELSGMTDRASTCTGC